MTHFTALIRRSSGDTVVRHGIVCPHIRYAGVSADGQLVSHGREGVNACAVSLWWVT